MLPGRYRRFRGERRMQISMVMPVPIAQDFIEFCDANRLTYWEAVEALLSYYRRTAAQARPKPPPEP